MEVGDNRMSSRNDRNSKVADFVGLLIVGLGVGWLLGMSATPVVSIVITSLTATAAAVLAVMSGLEGTTFQENTGPNSDSSRARKHIYLAPIVALVVGIVVGASVGLTSRSYAWFGTDLDAEISKWTRHGRNNKKSRTTL